MGYEDLLLKLESHLKKDMLTHTFDIDALVTIDQGQSMRMKITDDFELRCLMDLTKLPTIYVDACERIKSISQNINSDDDDALIGSLTTLPPIVQTLSESTSSYHGISSQWTIRGVSQQVCIASNEFPSIVESIPREQLICGSFFPNKHSLTAAIGTFHLRNFFECITKCSDTGRHHVVCKFGTCNFSIRSQSFGKA